MEIRRLLKVYEENSGQMINLAKSSITFGKNIELTRKTKIKEILGIAAEGAEGGTGKYLDLSECFSGSKAEMLCYIHEKMNSRFHGWYGRFLSAGGKKTSCSKLWQWQCPSTPCQSSSFLRVHAKISQVRCRTFGGMFKKERIRFIGLHGRRYV